MRTYISESGFYAFWRSTDLSLAAGLIGPAERRLRLSFLRDMLDPDTDALFEWGWPGADGHEEDDEGHESPVEAEFVESVDRDGRVTGGPMFKGSAAEPELVVRLMSAPSPRFGARWLFHQADPDWFPSVPHGHLQSQEKTKLDTYRGWVYDTSRNNRVAGRESKDFIARLWNETAFRALATNALQYFCEFHPAFDWYRQRGILEPRYLPRFRRRRT